MSLTDQRAAYEDCYRLYERAVNSRRGAGVRVPFPTENEAKFFALRMNKARSIQRRDSRRIYSLDAPLYDTSEFDHLQVIVRPDSADPPEWWVFVKPHAVAFDVIEDLAEDDDPDDLLAHDPDALQLTDQRSQTDA